MTTSNDDPKPSKIKIALRKFQTGSKKFLRGELLLLGGYKHMRQILLAGLLLATALFFYLRTEAKLAHIEKNKEELKNLRIAYSQKQSELASFERASVINQMLSKHGLSIGIPHKPITMIDE